MNYKDVIISEARDLLQPPQLSQLSQLSQPSQLNFLPFQVYVVTIPNVAAVMVYKTCKICEGINQGISFTLLKNLAVRIIKGNSDKAFIIMKIPNALK